MVACGGAARTTGAGATTTGSEAGGNAASGMDAAVAMIVADAATTGGEVRADAIEAADVGAGGVITFPEEVIRKYPTTATPTIAALAIN